MCSSLTEGEGCLAGAKRFDVIGRSTLSLAAPADSSGTSWSWPVARLSAGAGRAGGGRLNGCCLPRRIENGPCLPNSSIRRYVGGPYGETRIVIS